MISFTIPTLNSSLTLGMTITSILDQDINEQFEIVVVDGGSTDNSVEIAEAGGAKVVRNAGMLLGARRRGMQHSKGQIIALLDSDQILREGSINAARDKLEHGCDMIVMGERVYRPQSLTERLSDLDKQLLTRDIASQLDPLTGVMLPRVFRRDLLEAAFSRIPDALDELVVAHDHAIIYFECCKTSSRVGYIPDAMWHLEPTRLVQLWRKNYRYGWSTRQLLKTGHYADLIGSKTRVRRISGNSDLRLRLGSLAFLGLKSIPYFAGYAAGNRFRSATRR